MARGEGKLDMGQLFAELRNDNEERERGGLILYCNLDFGNFKEHALSYLNRFPKLFELVTLYIY